MKCLHTDNYANRFSHYYASKLYLVVRRLEPNNLTLSDHFAWMTHFSLECQILLALNETFFVFFF